MFDIPTVSTMNSRLSDIVSLLTTISLKLVDIEHNTKNTYDKLDEVIGEEAGSGVVVMNSLLHPELTVFVPA